MDARQQTAAVLTAVTVILQGSAVTNLNSTHQIQALVISVRLSFFLNAAACFAAAENILAIVNKGYNVIEAREAHRVAILLVFGGTVFFLVTTCFWMWMHVLWAKVVTLLTILSLSGWALHNIVKD